MARKKRVQASLFGPDDESGQAGADPNEDLIGVVFGNWKVLGTWHVLPEYVEVGELVVPPSRHRRFSVRPVAVLRRARMLS